MGRGAVRWVYWAAAALGRGRSPSGLRILGSVMVFAGMETAMGRGAVRWVYWTAAALDRGRSPSGLRILGGVMVFVGMETAMGRGAVRWGIGRRLLWLWTLPFGIADWDVDFRQFLYVNEIVYNGNVF